MKVLQRAKHVGCDEIVSIGGGSTIDVGKFVAFHLGVKHTAIPTTAGTGSEVTKFAVFVDNGKKVSLENDKLIPDKVIMDPKLTLTLSPEQTAASGLDALSQAIESHWSPSANQISQNYSFMAISLAMNNLFKSYSEPKNLEWRKLMMLAANFSGRAINITRTSICHAISYPLTIRYGIPHGIACAITLPLFLEYYKIKSFHINNSECYITSFDVSMLLVNLGINISEILKDVDLEFVATEALKVKRSKNVPYPISKKKLIKLLKSYA